MLDQYFALRTNSECRVFSPFCAYMFRMDTQHFALWIFYLDPLCPDNQERTTDTEKISRCNSVSNRSLQNFKPCLPLKCLLYAKFCSGAHVVRWKPHSPAVSYWSIWVGNRMYWPYLVLTHSTAPNPQPPTPNCCSESARGTYPGKEERGEV